MKALVIGSGGREHALAWALSRSRRVEKVWCAPGNGGIAGDVETVDLDPSGEEGMQRLADFARRQGVDLTVVGPEAPLVAGIADRFEAAGLPVFGPSAAAARLEGSKCFTKEFLRRHGIPTAGYRVFDDVEAARAHVEGASFPLVVKADGLAAGKGVLICKSAMEALAAVDTVMVARRFGAAGDRLVVEEFLSGTELTVIVLTDGETVVPIETAQDYKPALDGNRGPNTGGMGSYSPHVPLGSSLVSEILETIIHPTLAGLREDGITYRGALYAGLMLTNEGPRLLEYNVRFGDPEIQAIVARLRTDLADVLEACVAGRLSGTELEWDSRHSVCVVAASAGYPGPYTGGKEIRGIDEANALEGTKVFVAGAGLAADGTTLVTTGGRVLGVTSLGGTRREARERAYTALARISFEGMTHRGDIGITQGHG